MRVAAMARSPTEIYRVEEPTSSSTRQEPVAGIPRQRRLRRGPGLFRSRIRRARQWRLFRKKGKRPLFVAGESIGTGVATYIAGRFPRQPIRHVRKSRPDPHRDPDTAISFTRPLR
jgi:hypothetical protein